MDTANLLDPTDLTWELATFARVPYAGCLSIGILGHVIVCAMPQLIEPDEVARPLSPLPAFEFRWHDAHDDEPSPVDFEPPLLAAGRFTTVARPGTLPPLEWDD